MSLPDVPYGDAATRLWEETETDWFVTVSLTLTEPVCAIVNIEPDDGSPLPALNGFIGGYDINKSVQDACEYLLRNIATHKGSQRQGGSET